MTSPPGGGTTRLLARRVPARQAANRLATLLREGFDTFTAESAALKVRTQYVDNPAGEAEVIVLETADGEPVGMQALVRRPFALGEHRIEGAIFADFVVLPAYRALGPALLLARETLDVGRAVFAFAFGFPNEKARLIFMRAGLRPSMRLMRYGRPLRGKRLVANLLPQPVRRIAPLLAPFVTTAIVATDVVRTLRAGRRLRWTEIDAFDDAFDELWNVAEREDLMLSLRTRASLEWRFRHREGHRISVARGSQGHLEAYVVWTTRGGAAVVLDIFCRRPARDLHQVLSGFAWRARRFGQEALSIELLAPPAVLGSLARAGLRERESSDVVLLAGHAGAITDPGARLFLTHADRDSI